MPELSEENNNVNVKKLDPADLVDLVDDDDKSGKDPTSLTTSASLTDDQLPMPTSTPSRNKKVKIDLKTSEIRSGEDRADRRHLADMVASAASASASPNPAVQENQVKPPVHKVSSSSKLKFNWSGFRKTGEKPRGLNLKERMLGLDPLEFTSAR